MSSAQKQYATGGYCIERQTGNVSIIAESSFGQQWSSAASNKLFL